jgi:hypothetical protein
LENKNRYNTIYSSDKEEKTKPSVSVSKHLNEVNESLVGHEISIKFLKKTE